MSADVLSKDREILTILRGHEDPTHNPRKDRHRDPRGKLLKQAGHRSSPFVTSSLCDFQCSLRLSMALKKDVKRIETLCLCNVECLTLSKKAHTDTHTHTVWKHHTLPFAIHVHYTSLHITIHHHTSTYIIVQQT